MPVLDEPMECPRCGRTVEAADLVEFEGRKVWVCIRCSEKPLGQMLVEFRKLVHGIIGAVDAHCPECGGAGWTRKRSGGPQGANTRLYPCTKCACTGVDMDALLTVLAIERRPRPDKTTSNEGSVLPSASGRDAAHKG